MNENVTEIVFVLDRSGSMAGLEKDTIGSFNAMLNRQKKNESRAYLTTVLFDDRIEVIHNRKDIREVRGLTDKQYYVRGCTALLDAVGYTIQKIRHEKARGSKVIFFITTDGYENASREYSYGRLKKLIANQKEKGWEFIFLGANIDSAAAAGKFGVNVGRVANFVNDAQGIKRNYEALDRTITSFRTTGTVSDDWKKDIDSDYEARH